MTRKTLIQGWFAAVAAIAVLLVVLGSELSLESSLLMLAASVVPPAVLLVLWPRDEPQTASEVLHGTNRNPRG